MSKTVVVAVGKITPTEKLITVLHGGLREDPPVVSKPSQSSSTGDKKK